MSPPTLLSGGAGAQIAEPIVYSRKCASHGTVQSPTGNMLNGQIRRDPISSVHREDLSQQHPEQSAPQKKVIVMEPTGTSSTPHHSPPPKPMKTGDEDSRQETNRHSNGLDIPNRHGGHKSVLRVLSCVSTTVLWMTRWPWTFQ